MENNAKNNLKKDIKKKITTTMIGALSSMENNLGRLWGHHKEEGEDLTPQEEKFLEIWERMREEILDRGNAQIGAMLSNLDKYDIQETKYTYTFITRRNHD